MVILCLPFALPSYGNAGKAKAKKRVNRERVRVVGVLATTDEEHVVVLRTVSEPARYLPIWIGEVEAINIRLRLQRQTPPRPLTLNLLESILTSGEIELTEIAIDDLREGVFLGKVSLRQRGKVWSVDARPSDAIGLAVGHDAPIYVATRILEQAAVDPADLEEPKAPAAPKVGADDDGPADRAPVNYEETL